MLLDRAVPEGETPSTVSIHGLTPQTLPAFVETLDLLGSGYVKACGYKAEPGQVLMVPGKDGALACVLFGVEKRMPGIAIRSSPVSSPVFCQKAPTDLQMGSTIRRWPPSASSLPPIGSRASASRVHRARA